MISKACHEFVDFDFEEGFELQLQAVVAQQTHEMRGNLGTESKCEPISVLMIAVQIDVDRVCLCCPSDGNQSETRYIYTMRKKSNKITRTDCMTSNQVLHHE